MAEIPPYESVGGDAAGVAIGEALFSDYGLAGVPPNPGMGVWFYRTAYDAMLIGPDASITKHQPEWRALLPTPAGGWPAPGPPVGPVAPVAPRDYTGNMCGIRVPGLPAVQGGSRDTSLVLSWLYGRYNAADRATIRKAWLQKGYKDVLLSWPDDRSVGYSAAGFLGLCQELNADGFRPCVMLLSKDYDPPTFDACKASIDTVLTGLLAGPYASRICIGWELSLWLSPTQVQQLIDYVAPQTNEKKVPLYVHFQQGYFAFQQPGHVTADFWNLNVGKLTGVLHQRDLSWTTEAEYQDRLVDCLERFAGKFGFSPNSGYGHPFDLIALEITAQPQFSDGMTEATGDTWGDWAIDTPTSNGPLGVVRVMGSGNGHH